MLSRRSKRSSGALEAEETTKPGTLELSRFYNADVLFLQEESNLKEAMKSFRLDSGHGERKGSLLSRGGHMPLQIGNILIAQGNFDGTLMQGCITLEIYEWKALDGSLAEARTYGFIGSALPGKGSKPVGGGDQLAPKSLGYSSIERSCL